MKEKGNRNENEKEEGNRKGKGKVSRLEVVCRLKWILIIMTKRRKFGIIS